MADNDNKKSAQAKRAAARRSEQDKTMTNNRKKVLKAQMEQPTYRFPIKQLIDYKEANGATATVEALKVWESELPGGWVRTALAKSRKALDRGQDAVWMQPLVYNSVKHTDLKDKIFENVGIPGADSVAAVASKLVDKGPQFLLQIQEKVDGGLPDYDNDAVEKYGELPNWFVPTATIDKTFTNELSQQTQEMLFTLAPQQVREVVLQAKEVAASKGISPEAAMQHVGAKVMAKMANGETVPPEDQISSTPAQQMDRSIIGAKSNLQDQGDQMRGSLELNDNVSLKAQAPRGSSVKLPTEPYNSGGKVLGTIQKVLSERSTYVPEVPTMSSTPPMPQAYAEGGSVDRVDQVLARVGSQAGSQPVPQAPASSDSWELYKNTVGGIESQNTYNIVGGYNDHYDGRYQMGREAKTDAARYLGIPVPSREEFRANPALQDEMFAAFTDVNRQTLNKLSPRFREMSSNEQQQILGYAHNQGAGGAIDFINTGVSGKDGFGTAGTKYIDAIAEAQSSSPAGGADAIARRNLEAEVDRTANDWIPFNESGARDNLLKFEQGLSNLNVPAVDTRFADVPTPGIYYEDTPRHSEFPEGASKAEGPEQMLPTMPSSFGVPEVPAQTTVPSVSVPIYESIPRPAVDFSKMSAQEIRSYVNSGALSSREEQNEARAALEAIEDGAIPRGIPSGSPTVYPDTVSKMVSPTDVPPMMPSDATIPMVDENTASPSVPTMDIPPVNSDAIPNAYREYGESREEADYQSTQALDRINLQLQVTSRDAPMYDFLQKERARHLSNLGRNDPAYTGSIVPTAEVLGTDILTNQNNAANADTAIAAEKEVIKEAGERGDIAAIQAAEVRLAAAHELKATTLLEADDMVKTREANALEDQARKNADIQSEITDFNIAIEGAKTPEGRAALIAGRDAAVERGNVSKLALVHQSDNLPVLSNDVITSYNANTAAPAKDIIRTGAQELGSISAQARRTAVADGEVIATIDGRDIKQVGNAWVSVSADGKFRPASEAEIKGIQFANAGDNTGADVVVSADVQRTNFVEQWMTDNPGRTQGEAIDAYEDSMTQKAVTSINTDPVNVGEVDTTVKETNVSSTEVNANSTGNATVDSVIQGVTNSANSVDDLMGNIEQKIAGLKKEHSAAWRKSVITGLVGYALVMATGGSFAQAMEAAKFGMQIGGGDLDFVNKQLAIYEGAQGDALTAKLNVAIKKDFPEELPIERQLNFAKRMLDSGQWNQATHDAYQAKLIGGSGGESTLDERKSRFASEQLRSGEWSQSQHDAYVQKEFFGGTSNSSDNLLSSGWEGSDGKIYFDTADVPEGVSITGKAGTADSTIANPWVKAQVAALEEVKAADVQLAQITNVLTTIPDDPWSGVFGQAKKTYADLTGSQAAEDIWRTQVIGLTTSTAIASLPKGPASDKDIELVLRGQIDGFANPEAVRQFTKAAQRLSNYKKRYNTELSNYIQNNRTAAGFVGPAYDPSGVDNATIGTVSGGSDTVVDDGTTSVDLDLSNLGG